jgi:hypothetical protein
MDGEPDAPAAATVLVVAGQREVGINDDRAHEIALFSGPQGKAVQRFLTV